MTPQTTVLVLPKSKNLSSYSTLVKRVREAITQGRERALDAVGREKVRTAWEVGKLIQEHILLNKARADYGAQVLKKLSSDLGISNTELKYMREFARTYPAIGRVPGQLDWSQIQVLLAINDDKVRTALASRAAKENWTWEKIRSEIKKLKATKRITTSEIPAETPLEPKTGKLNTYKIVIAEIGPFKGKPVVDLGFSNYTSVRDIQISTDSTSAAKRRHHLPAGKFPFKEGDIVTLEKGKLKSSKTATEADLFTFRAYVDEVTDADTLWVLVDLGFSFTTKQQLRLRGIDCPEINSREGLEAKKFVEQALKKIPYVTITSTKSDKYDRYLADVFLPLRSVKTSSGGIRATKHEHTQDTYLNNELLKRGLATRIDY